MRDLLASANPAFDPNATIRVLVDALLWIALIALFAAVPVVLAAWRGHRHAGVIVSLSVVVAIVASASAYATLADRDQWTREEDLLTQSGYYDPQDHTQPVTPWPLWAALGGAYCGIVVWSLTGPRRPTAPAHADPEP